MISLIPHGVNWLEGPGWTAAFLDVCIKSAVILVVAAGVCFLWRRAAASARHLVWFSAVIGVLCLPVVSTLLPARQHALWSVGTRSQTENDMVLTFEIVPAGGRMISQAAEEVPSGAAAEPAPAAVSNTRPISIQIQKHWTILAFGFWVSGVVGYLMWVAFGHLRLRVARSTAVPCDENSQALLREITEQLHIRRRVKLLHSRENLIPMTWGWIRPVILLPAGAQEWPAERLRLVLLHEMGHVVRWDCLTQSVTQLACALHWFNPLIWLAARRMNVERECACDDLVLNGGCRASDYAGHLVEIARRFRRVPYTAAGIAMARSSRLGGRIEAIVDSSRARRFSHSLLVGCLAAVVLILVSAVAAPNALDKGSKVSEKRWFDARLRTFFKAKEQQARILAGDEPVSQEVWKYFEAGTNGDWITTTNLWSDLRERTVVSPGKEWDATLPKVWSPILETVLAWETFSSWKEKYVLAFGQDIIKSVPPGSIYFGGTDAGRGVITAMSESHADGRPFFTITQNALADSKYQEYLRKMYGGKIYMPDSADSQKCFQEYIGDAQRRLRMGKLRPGEDVRVLDNRIQVSGGVAVMQINGLLAKIIFDQNTNREFYVEESRPLDWMYPHLSPNGLIMKVNREPLAGLSDETVRKDREYWSRYLKPMIGGWLKEGTSVAEVAAFVEKVYLKHNLRGFSGDLVFVEDAEAQKFFSKLRSSIGGVYAWRANHAKSPEEKQRMTKEADFAFRQAFALCPINPELLSRYGDLLDAEHRAEDLRILAETALKFDPENATARDLIKKSQQSGNLPANDRKDKA